jgi:predicted RNA binding protein YcfA (HicA-like mRNA interferase family)
MTASFLISYLERAGWKQVRQQGIHRILINPDRPNFLSIPDLGEQSLKPGLVNDICREAGLKGRVHRLQFGPKRMVVIVKKLLGMSR